MMVVFGVWCLVFMVVVGRTDIVVVVVLFENIGQSVGRSGSGSGDGKERQKRKKRCGRGRSGRSQTGIVRPRPPRARRAFFMGNDLPPR